MLSRYLPLILLVAFPASAAQIDLLFDVRFDRMYSYDGTPLAGISPGDTFTMAISFNNEISSTRKSMEPWGPGTAKLYSYLNGPTVVDSPFTSYIPTNPILNPVNRLFSVAGVTANERLSINENIWYEDLWFYNQYSQFSQSSTDGIDAYRYKFNIHWNKTNYDYVPGKLYYFDELDVINVLDRAINEGITFSISEDAYIDYSDGSFSGYDLDGTATLMGYNITSTVPTPPALWLFGSGLLGLIGVAREKAA